jgi:hypothetical protein
MCSYWFSIVSTAVRTFDFNGAWSEDFQERLIAFVTEELGFGVVGLFQVLDVELDFDWLSHIRGLG